MRFIIIVFCWFNFVTISLLPSILVSQDKNLIQKRIITLYENDSYDKAYQEANLHYESMQNNFAFRKLYFHILLKKKLFDKAQLQLNWLIKIKQGIEIDYLKALYFYESDQIQQAERHMNSILKKDKRHIPTLLLLIDISYEKKIHSKILQYLKMIEIIDPNNQVYLYKKGLFYLDRNSREFNKVLTKLNALYSESPLYFHLNALSLQKQKLFKPALTWLNRALYYKPKNKEYRNLKAQLYFSLKEYRNLIQFLQNKIISADNAEYYYLASLHYAMAKKSNWTINDINYIKINVLPNIKNYLESESDDELVRHFGELIILSNFNYTAKERELFVPYHLSRAKFFHYRGVYQKAKSEYINTIRLAPQNIVYRRLYATLLKDIHLDNAYLDQLAIIKRLSSESKQDDYKLDTTIQLLKRKLLKALHNKENIPNDRRTSTKTRVLLIENEQTPMLNNFLQAEIYHSLLQSVFNSIHKCAVFSSKKDTQEDAIANHNIDFILTYKLSMPKRSKNIGLSIFLYDANTRKLINKKTFYASGKDKLFNINLLASQYLENIIPLKGRVLKINAKNIVISLGVLDGIKLKDKFNIYFSPKPSDTAPIEVIALDETIALAKILDTKNINFIKINNLVKSAQ